MLKLKYADTLPSKLYFAEQIKRAEPICAKFHGISMVQLMERAGHAVFEAMCAQYPEAKKIIIIAGSGNNGGDGYVVGRLALLAGFKVDLFAKPLNKANEDALLASQAFIGAGGEVEPIGSLKSKANATDYDVVVDALLGHGFRAPLRQADCEIIAFLNAMKSAKVAIDLPSGLEADTGIVDPIAFEANLTITFVGLKIGLFTADGPDHHGSLIFEGLGIEDTLNDVEASRCRLVHKYSMPTLRKRKYNSHKGNFGNVLVIGGAAGMTGAALLAGKAALRSGCGKVRVLCESIKGSEVISYCPELMLTLSTHKEVGEQIEQAICNADVVIFGPGLGHDQWSQNAFRSLMAINNIEDKRLIVDAGGLTWLAQDMASISTRPKNWICTPHPLEAARLLDCTTKQINRNRIKSAQQLASNLNATVVLKGCGSVIASEKGISINISGNPGMATAGMGDVLNGVIAGMWLADFGDKVDLQLRAEAGVYLHGLAGDFTANDMEIGMIATDVINNLPFAIKDSL